MKPSDRLKEIAHENLMSGGDKDMGWLITRVEKLTEVLEQETNIIEMLDVFWEMQICAGAGSIFKNWQEQLRNHTKIARQALEDE
jgi:hypothetical protein